MVDRPQPPDGSAESDGSAPAPRRLLPIGLGAIVAGAFVIVLLLSHPDVRGWLRLNLFLPTVVRVLGRDVISLEGVVIPQGPGPYAALALASVYVTTLLLIRALLLVHAGEGGKHLGERIRLDSSLALAVVPFLATAAVIETLAVTQLFRFPWVFLSVPPLIVHFTVALLLVSLVLSLWTESGGLPHHRGRFLASALIFLAFDLSWTAVFQGTTRPLPWWIPFSTVLVGLIVYHGVTIGGRIVSHRRALFSLGCLHLAFFAGFVTSWFTAGPWPVMEWSYAGYDAVRTLHGADVRLLVLTIGPPALIAAGAYTLGSFLHAYSRLANVWIDGLAVTALFGQALDAWVSVLAAHDPYGALDRTILPDGIISSWAIGFSAGWPYLWAKLILAVLLISLVVRLPRLRRGRGLEAQAVLLAVIAGIGLAPGLRLALGIAMGV